MAESDKSAERRSQIIEAMMDCLDTASYQDTSLKDIADKAGLNSGLLYYYFPTKEEILLAVVDELTATYIRVMREWEQLALAEEAKESDFWPALAKLVAALYDSRLEYTTKSYCLLWGLAVHNEQVKTKLAASYRLCEDSLRTAMEHYNVSSVEQEQFARMFMALLEGIGLFSYL